MSSYIIEGGHKLEGTVKISGSKNAALPILAATVLNVGKTTLYNVPNIQDTQMMFKILETLGGKVEKKNNKIIIDTSKINKFEIPEELMHKNAFISNTRRSLARQIQKQYFHTQEVVI